MVEQDLSAQRQQFLADTEQVASFFSRIGVTKAEQQQLKVSLFCYPHAPVASLLSAWQQCDTPLICLVPEGVATETVASFLGQAAQVGASATRGSLTLRVIPFLPQQDYDRLLWACDVNFVRGEDSFVRAQWANKPFIWHIYPQDENLHHVKLKAFLHRYTAKTENLNQLALMWNEAETAHDQWTEVGHTLLKELPHITEMCTVWEHEMRKNGDFSTNLLKFAATLV